MPVEKNTLCHQWLNRSYILKVEIVVGIGRLHPRLRTIQFDQCNISNGQYSWLLLLCPRFVPLNKSSPYSLPWILSIVTTKSVLNQDWAPRGGSAVLFMMKLYAPWQNLKPETINIANTCLFTCQPDLEHVDVVLWICDTEMQRARCLWETD